MCIFFCIFEYIFLVLVKLGFDWNIELSFVFVFGFFVKKDMRKLVVYSILDILDFRFVIVWNRSILIVLVIIIFLGKSDGWGYLLFIMGELFFRVVIFL